MKRYRKRRFETGVFIIGVVSAVVVSAIVFEVYTSTLASDVVRFEQ